MKNITWKLKELEDAVRDRYGESYANQIHEPLQSFHIKSMTSIYHADEYKNILKSILALTENADNENSEMHATVLAIFRGLSDEKNGSDIIEAKFKAEAHIIASAQALHSLCDILAHIIYLAFKLDSYSDSPSENRINLHSINKVLKKNSIYGLTQKSITNITSSPEWDYLNAYVNTSKHKSLIPASLSASFLGNKSGILIKEFTYSDFQGKAKHFRSKWSQDFVDTDNRNLRYRLLETGTTLNHSMIKKTPSA